MTINDHAMEAGYEAGLVAAWQCASCGCRTFARVDERKGNGKFGPSDSVRCVGCKRTCTLPYRRASAPVEVQELVERLLRGSLYYLSESGPIYNGPTAHEREAATYLTALSASCAEKEARWEHFQKLASDHRAEIEAEITRLTRAVEERDEALEQPFAVVFLDGRNEHGTHVLPSFPTGINPSDLQRELEAGTAELVMSEAEKLGFAAGDHVWTNWFFHRGIPEGGDPYGFEFVSIDVGRSKAIAARRARALGGK